MARHMTYAGGLRIEFNDNSKEVILAINNAINRGLKVCGEKAVGFAQNKCPVDTGRLRHSISYSVEGDECYIGTNVEYAPYVEMGTGKYAETGGRQTPWSYQDSSGVWHRTNGQKPQPFLRPACADHSDEYMRILKDSIENA